MTQDRYIIADASSVTGAEFFAHVAPLFGRTKPGPKDAELREAEAVHRAAIQAAYKLPKLADVVDAKATAEAAYRARRAEIELRHKVAEELRFTVAMQQRRDAA